MAAELNRLVADLRSSRERIAEIAGQVERHRADREELLRAIERIRDRLADAEGKRGSPPS
ncbi:MAG: hypothetical protein WA208_17040 [Thermoanaerobaculia bacterium]